jgi:hypothetical protein
MQAISDDLWAVMADTMKRYRGIQCNAQHKEAVEKQAEIKAFDGGVWASVGNEIDLFVLPQKQAKWNVRKEVSQYLADMHKRYPVLVARINENNTRSLRLARFFGFKDVSKEGQEIRLERKL